MSRVIIDTHVLAWSLITPAKLSGAAIAALEGASQILVPPSALHEISLKVRNGKWDDMIAHAGHLDRLCSDQGFFFAPYTARMAMAAGSLDWEHRDPFDRMIAATALELSFPLISKDDAFDGLKDVPGWKGGIWNNVA